MALNPRDALNTSIEGEEDSIQACGAVDADGNALEMMPCDPPHKWFSCRTFLLYAGPGWLMSLAYLDPGNLESDLQNGAYAGYSLVWVLFICTLCGLALQILAARLGTVTGRDLASTCRMYYSRTTSRTIWIMTEVAIIGSDLQEVVGTAIALRVLFGWPLWVGSLVTGIDTFTFLLMHYFGKRALETFIFVLVMVMMCCFFLNFFILPPPASSVLVGFVPSCPSYAVVQMVGTIGAVIMPHNIYLHSGLATARGVDRRSQLHVHQANKYGTVDSSVALLMSFFINAALQTTFANGFFYESCALSPGSPLACLRSATGPPDGCSGATCERCTTASGANGYCAEIGLENAGSALAALFGSHGELGRKVFALGVLAAGQASTMTGTIAGQYVMEGFVEWRVSIWVRTLITRTIALGPAVVVAVLTSSDPGLNNVVNEWLNILQSVQLPFALLPVLHFNSEAQVMGARFRLKKRYQVACWLLAAVVIITNIYLVYSRVFDKELWLKLLVAFLFILYVGFLTVIIQSDLRKLYAYLKSVFCR